jgi:hypothetical protein
VMPISRARADKASAIDPPKPCEFGAHDLMPDALSEPVRLEPPTSPETTPAVPTVRRQGPPWRSADSMTSGASWFSRMMRLARCFEVAKFFSG